VESFISGIENKVEETLHSDSNRQREGKKQAIMIFLGKNIIMKLIILPINKNKQNLKLKNQSQNKEN
jgi:hypothetical protein